MVPEVSGRIVELAVTDNQAVKQGDLLFRIDPRPYEANLAKAEPPSPRWISKLCSPSVASMRNSLVPTDQCHGRKSRAAAKQATDTLRCTSHY